MSNPRSDHRVTLVTGGGGGIGAAIATELARLGDHVVTLDPMVSIDGSGPNVEVATTTAERIVAAGGSAEASNASVTDRNAVATVVDKLMRTHGRIDAVVNVAGITRPTGFARGDESDWEAVLAVHLDGYQNVLNAVLPHMVTAGHGHVVGVTSGSGWRAADAGAYSCAKRAVAALTWQLGRTVPQGVSVNAMSPIAMTRMVTAALSRSGGSTPTASGSSARTAGTQPASAPTTGGLSLNAMPPPDHLGPLGAALAGHGSATIRGQVVFAGGSEIAIVDPPRLLEVVRTSDVHSLDAIVGTFADTLVAAEATQATGGGTNPRFNSLFDHSPTTDDGPVVGTAATGSPRTVAIVSDRPHLATALASRLAAAGVASTVVAAGGVPATFAAARAALDGAARTLGGLDAVVVALDHPPATGSAGDVQTVLASHDGLARALVADAAWARACAELATNNHPLRLIQLVDATTPGGRSRAQAVTQLARSSRTATRQCVTAVAVAVEHSQGTAAALELATHLVVGTHTDGLAGAEMVTGDGWLGVRSHPRPAGSIVFGGPALPHWFDTVMSELVT